MAPVPSGRVTGHALAITAIAVTIAWSVADLRRDPGWHDFRAMCRGLAAIDRGEPRLAYNGYPSHQLPITYPPLAVRLIQPLCDHETIQHVAWLLVLALATLVLVLAFRELPPLLTVLVSVSAFRAATWIMWTGNIAVIEFLLMALAVYDFRRGRHWFAAACIGVAGFVKLMPLAFLPVFAAVSGARRGWSAIATAVLTFAALHLASALVAPQATSEYWRALSAGFGGLIAVEAWYGSIGHPSLYSAALALGRRIGNPATTAGVIYVSTAVSLTAALVIASRGRHRDTAFWSGLVLVLLLVPRLKPYNFALAVPSACAAMTALTLRARIGLLIAISGLPFAAFAITGLDTRSYLLGYVQLVALFALYGMLLKFGPAMNAR